MGPTMTVGDLPAAFIRSGRGPRPSKDRAFAERVLHRFAVFIGQDTDLQEITEEHVRRFGLERLGHCRRELLKGREGVNQELKVIREALAWAQDCQLIDRAPEVRRIR